MRGKQIKFEVLLAAVVVLMVSGGAGMLLRPAAPPDQVQRARIGDVAWNHDFHARMKEIPNCTVCHHTERQGITNPKPCETCHSLFSNEEAVVMKDLFQEVPEQSYSGEQGPSGRDIFHGKCLGCHQAMSEGPVGCRDCHAQTFTGAHGMVAWDHRVHARQMGTECVSCHHKDEAATWDGEYRACRECHEPAAQLGLAWATDLVNDKQQKHKEAKHGQCHTCHTENNPENDLRSCGECHLGLKRAGEGEDWPPSREEAVHKKCMECHNWAYPGLSPDMPLFCIDCHKPEPSLIEEPGPVLFSHRRHSEYGDMTCDVCHHTDVPGEPHMACTQCHGADLFEGIPSAEEALNTRCLGCHEEKQVGLTQWSSLHGEAEELWYFKYEGEEGSFWWNHGFHSVDMAFSCRDCHHNITMKDGEYLTAAAVGEAWTEADGGIQSCKNCHKPGGKAPKSLTEAYKKACITCHERLGAGPVTWEAFFKSQ